jgi:hypothetical protein
LEEGTTGHIDAIEAVVLVATVIVVCFELAEQTARLAVAAMVKVDCAPLAEL